MITIKVEDKGVKDALKKLAKKTGDLTPVMRNIAGIMLDDVQENFQKEGQPRWTPLAASTIKQRTKKGKWPGKMLQVSAGGLYSSLSSKADRNSARVGTNKVYGAIQHFGGKAGRGHKVTIPARPFLVLSNKALEAIKTAILNYLGK